MKRRIQNKIQLIFLGAQETSTPEGRAKERARRIAQTSSSAIVARLINILSGLITVPLTLPYLGVELFGIWMALTGFVALLSFTDLGLGIGLQSALTKCYAKDDRLTPSKLNASAFSLIFIIMLALITFSIYLVPVFDLTNIISISEPSNEIILTQLTQCFLLVFALGLPAGIIHRIFIAYQDGLAINILLIVGRLVGLLSIFVGVYFQQSLIAIAAMYMGAPLIAITLGGVYLFWIKPWLRPDFSSINTDMMKIILSIGGTALFAQIGASIMSTGPLLVLSSQYGAKAVVPYILTQRLMSIVQIVIAVGVAPLWPAYGEAKVSGDFQWIKSTFYKSLKLSMAIALFSFFFFMLFGQSVISLWADNVEAVPGVGLLFACCVLMVVSAWTGPFSAFLNGLNQFKGQAVYGLLLPILAVYLGMNFSEGIGLVLTLWVFILVGELTRITFMAFESYRVIKRL
jgi:O-antigen/teichoic acid export membrane protein